MVRITLNKLLYSREAIEKAIDDFKDVFNAEIINDNFEIEISEQDQETIDEFKNYIIGVIKNA